MKIDFHVHTSSNQYLDQSFDFDEKAMIAYVHDNLFDAIAITNHNLFDKEQFFEIIKQLKDENCSIFPGIEISLEGGHILVIGDNTEVYIEKLEKISNYIRLNEKNDQYKMSVEQFNELIKQEDDFLIIPHYLKKPKISDDILKKIKANIFVGEVQGPKKFYSMKKEKRMTPVFFSDIRIKKATEKDFSTFYLNVSDYTYLKCDTCSFISIKNALKNIDATSLTDDFKGTLFEIMNGEAKASLGINVLLGKRSSGKTFTLDHVYGQGNYHTLYIRQFDIVKSCESEHFDSFLLRDNDETVIDFLREMNALFDYINQFSPFEIERELSDYLKSLMDSAEQHLEDVFSKAPLFKNGFLNETENQAERIYKALDILLSAPEKYKERIFENIHKDTIKELYAMFLKEAKNIFLTNQLIKKANEISNLIGKKLENKSNVIRIKKIDFKRIFKYRYIKMKFDSLIGKIQRKQISKKIIFNKFVITIELKREKNKTRLKSNLNINRRGVNIDYLFDEPPYFAFFDAKKDENIKNRFGEERYKLFFSIEKNVTTMAGFELSGGQKAEYVLLSKLDNYRSYDLILIDEMESSFDNPFLNNEIISQIRRMSEDAIIFISTHNNNLGVSLNPDFYIYHELQIDKGGQQIHKKFFGSPTSKELECKDGSSVELSEVLITTMEANDKAYKERKEKYENS